MQKIFLVVSLSVFFLNNVNAQNVKDSLMSGGVMRHYSLYLSANYSPGMPVIIALHPYSITGTSFATIAGFPHIADTGNFLVAYPEGLKDNTGNPSWNVGWPWQDPTNDLLFISDLIDSLHSRNNIDLNRVYACGSSNGAVMSHELGTRLSNKITAIASVSGSMPPNVFDTTVAKRVVPVIDIHGTNDDIFPWAGCSGCQFSSVPVDTLRKFWVNADDCTTEDSIAIPDINTSDGSTVEHYVFSGGTNGAPVELYKVIGGIHFDWPGSNFVAGDNKDFSASVAMWNFFKQYTLDEFPLGVKPVKAIQSVNFYPNPSTTIFQCNLPQVLGNSTIHVRLMNAMGQLVKNYAARPSSVLQLNLGDLPPGYYAVVLNNGKISGAGKLIKN